jgi:hypothetical protein
MVLTMDTTPVPRVPPDTSFLLTELDAGLQAELRLETNRARQIRLMRLRCLVDTLRGHTGDPAA